MVCGQLSALGGHEASPTLDWMIGSDTINIDGIYASAPSNPSSAAANWV